MTLNKQKGNMYPFVTHTWNPIKGRCPHNCNYCYMKNKLVGELRLDKKCLKDNLGSGNFIFVGSSTDMFADDVLKEWIIKVLKYCNKFPNNKYLFQTKNPKRFIEVINYFPKDVIFGTTIETNRDYKINKAPPTDERKDWIMKFPSHKTMISIEPIMIFDMDMFVGWIKEIEPKFISIGADSKNSKLPEPNKEEINFFIKQLKQFTEVRLKDNLNRLMATQKT
jgi:DNA repair photolyase